LKKEQDMSTPVLAGRPEPDVSSQQKLTQQELDQARLFLQQTQSALVGATKGLSEAQWKFKPAPDRWSVAENLDHIVLVQERVLGPILDQLANAPAPAADHDYVQVDAIVIHQFSTRLNKFPAPEFYIRLTRLRLANS
jgi:multidrug efflux pump subunit AcrA (membrane-fusion protein)